MSAADFGIPPRMREAVERYLIQHVKPGDFLCAVLQNDLRGAVERADDQNIRLIPNYVRYLYNEAPARSWGSPEYFAAWLAHAEVTP